MSKGEAKKEKVKATGISCEVLLGDTIFQFNIDLLYLIYHMHPHPITDA